MSNEMSKACQTWVKVALGDADGDVINIKIGDWVSFKCDIEQTARVIEIRGNRITVEAPCEGFEGAYIRFDETHELNASECWV